MSYFLKSVRENYLSFKDFCVVECDTVYSGRSIPKFQQNRSLACNSIRLIILFNDALNC